MRECNPFLCLANVNDALSAVLTTVLIHATETSLFLHGYARQPGQVSVVDVVDRQVPTHASVCKNLHEDVVDQQRIDQLLITHAAYLQ